VSEAAAVEADSLALVEMTVAAMSSPRGLSTLQVRVLLAVDRHGPLNLSAMARRLDVSVPSASRLVDRLVDAGLLTRGVSTHSRREIALTVSTKGRRALTQLRRRREAAIAKVLDEMSDGERSALVTGLHGFAEAAFRVPAG
jgi:DNA-binding MarR family transcriptional regulator